MRLIDQMRISSETGIQPDLDLLQNRGYAPGVSKETSVDNDALLRWHGLQVTAQRLAVLRAVSDRRHSTADDIYTVVRVEIGAISRQAVYDALAALTEKGLVRRIQPARSPARYEDRVGDNHHHLICRTCSQMVDVDCAVGYTPCLTAADDSGYEIDEAEVIYWGRCPECVAATSVSCNGAKRTRSVRHQLSSTALDPEQQTSRTTSHQKEPARKEKDRHA
jgi:Fur family ferric uptake transcriptional regulator